MKKFPLFRNRFEQRSIWLTGLIVLSGTSMVRPDCFPPNVPAHSRTVCLNGHGTRQMETAIAVSGSVVVVSYNDYRGAYCTNQGYQVSAISTSLDYGASFQEGLFLPGGNQWGADPWLATGPDSSIYHSALTSPSAGKLGIILNRGDVATNGITWTTPIVYLPPLGSVDKPSMAIAADGTIYIAYTLFVGTSNPQSGLWVLRSSDRGQSFEGPYQVAFSSPADGSNGVFLVAGLNGELFLAWKVGTSSAATNTIYFARSLDRGQTYSAPQTISTDCPFPIPGTDANAVFPQLAQDQGYGTNRGTLYLAWQTACPLGTNSPGDIVLCRSSDAGTNWSTPIVVNSDAGQAAHTQPALTVDATGKVWLFFYRSQTTGVSNLATADLLAAQSGDGGWHFTPVLPVTDTPSTWGYTAEAGAMAYGDYNAAISTSDSVFVAYTDARFGDPDVFVIRLPHTPAPPEITSTSHTGTNFAIKFTGTSGFNYSVENTTYSPANPSWVVLGNATCGGTNYSFTATNTPNAAAQFYRVKYP